MDSGESEWIFVHIITFNNCDRPADATSVVTFIALVRFATASS